MAAIVQAQKTLYMSSTSSPYGECVVMATEAGVCWAGTPGTPAIEGKAWVEHRLPVTHVVSHGEIASLRLAMDELRRYLAGERVEFTCPLDLYGTPFQVVVWQELLRIPYGETRTYAEIARATGRPAASRAVGMANGANPVAIIVPCHRVIGSNGSLTGYGGGLPTKRWLLTLEGNHQFR